MLRGRPLGILVTVLGTSLLTSGSPAGDPDVGFQFFETRVRPLLAEHCYRCHSTELAEPAGGLSLDTGEGIRRGGHSGAGVVPGNPDRSLVLRALQHRGLEMPPDEKLPSAQITAVREWIAMGAPDPRVPAEGPKTDSPESGVEDHAGVPVLLRSLENHPAGCFVPFSLWPDSIALRLLR